MLAAGIKTPVPLEELEIHLREEIERQMRSGLSAQQAFGIAARKIGQAPELKREFKKIGDPMEMQKIIQLAGVIFVALALFCPLFLFLPFVTDPIFSLTAKMLALALYAITVATIVLSWKYNHKLLPVIRNQPLRRAIGIVCYGASAALDAIRRIRFFTRRLVPPKPFAVFAVSVYFWIGMDGDGHSWRCRSWFGKSRIPTGPKAGS